MSPLHPWFRHTSPGPAQAISGGPKQCRPGHIHWLLLEGYETDGVKMEYWDAVLASGTNRDSAVKMIRVQIESLLERM